MVGVNAEGKDKKEGNGQQWRNVVNSGGKDKGNGIGPVSL